MTKEQAQIYINNVGQAYKHYTRGLYFLMLFFVLAFFGAAVGFCHEPPIVIIACALSVFGIVFTAVAVKKYMSILRISVVNTVCLTLLAVAVDCIAYAILYYDGSFVAWEYCLCIGIQVLTFVLCAVVCYVIAGKAKPKKVMLASVAPAATAGILGVSLSRFITDMFHPSSDTALLILTVLLNVTACLILLCIAVLVVRVVIMRKYGVSYKQDWVPIDRLCVVLNLRDNFTVVRAFAYDKYTLYIYVKRKKFELQIYEGKKRIFKQKHDSARELLDKAKINGRSLSEIWNYIMPL